MMVERWSCGRNLARAFLFSHAIMSCDVDASPNWLKNLEALEKLRATQIFRMLFVGCGKEGAGSRTDFIRTR